jgi:hypothetical protein
MEEEDVSSDFSGGSGAEEDDGNFGHDDQFSSRFEESVHQLSQDTHQLLDGFTQRVARMAARRSPPAPSTSQRSRSRGKQSRPGRKGGSIR